MRFLVCNFKGNRRAKEVRAELLVAEVDGKSVRSLLESDGVPGAVVGDGRFPAAREPDSGRGGHRFA
jgi:hypothetical protein